MSDAPQWLMRIEGSLTANFFQPDGSSRPGTDWKVGVQHGADAYQVMVRSYLSNDATSKTRKDTNYQGQKVMGYVNDLIEKGWRPDSPIPSFITIGNPSTGGDTSSDDATKAWWKFW